MEEEDKCGSRDYEEAIEISQEKGDVNLDYNDNYKWNLDIFKVNQTGLTDDSIVGVR